MWQSGAEQEKMGRMKSNKLFHCGAQIFKGKPQVIMIDGCVIKTPDSEKCFPAALLLKWNLCKLRKRDCTGATPLHSQRTGASP